jgi:hypothetical protein
MNPAEERHALRGRSILSCWDLWVTAILHAILIGALALWYQWSLGAWPLRSSDSSYRLVEAVLVLNAHWVVFGILFWAGDIGAYWLIRVRRGLKHALVFGTTMTLVWTLVLLASLAREFMTVNEDIIY